MSSYQLIRSKRRTLELRVHPDARVEIRAPMKCPRAEIDAFFQQRQDWVARQLERITSQPLPDPLADGARIYYLGEQKVLRVTTGRSAVHERGDEILLCCPAPDQPESVQRVWQSQLRRRAAELFGQRLAQIFPAFEQRGHARMPALKIRSMRSRWGSLSRHSGMTLNLALIHSPLECIDYVIVHELCHLEHMNHGPRFKQLMTRMMPDWPQRRQRLNSTTWSR